MQRGAAVKDAWLDLIHIFAFLRTAENLSKKKKKTEP
jgi:hypothetical protein